MKKLTAVILSLCLGVAGLTGCQADARGTNVQASDHQEAETADQSGPKTITDHAGNQVEIPAQVNRVVVTDILPLPSIITVFLGSGEKIVGMNPASMSAAKTGLLGELFPDILNASTDFMNGSDINMEELMKLEPDVVFYNAGSKEMGEALTSAGFAAVAVSVNKWDYDSIETYDHWVELLSQIFPEKGDTADKVSQYSQKVYKDIQKRVSGLKKEEQKNILFLFNYSDTTMITSGKKFFGQFWCDAVGGRNAAEGVAAENSNAVINMEQVYEWNPDVIFITNFTPVQPEDLFENAVGQDDWSPVKAVQDGHVYKLPLGTYRSYTPSTDTPMTLLWMAKQVYPDLFEDVDITKEVKDYYQAMYGVKLSDEQVERMYHPGRDAAAGYKK
ncbi:ABC transporter substrate-binding protein [Enterocloster citroniae]